MSEHFIERCNVCRTITAQCRCPASEKAERWTVCESCKVRPALPAATASAGEAFYPAGFVVELRRLLDPLRSGIGSFAIVDKMLLDGIATMLEARTASAPPDAEGVREALSLLIGAVEDNGTRDDCDRIADRILAAFTLTPKGGPDA